MNRAERRRKGKGTNPVAAAVARADVAQREQEQRLRDQAIVLAASIPGPGETVEVALRDLAAGIAGLEANPIAKLVAGPALEVLRRRRDELAAM